ncbi:nitrate reductase associated protein [Phenylobacterium sp.]|uniref:nitrate reductase associated protein n=1 Tax=Phenylobacterium sp. TaxID=1871053 RepID=UPI00286C740E|nr:nitrate reductase associated protein [Phenylobacterium sp.]
MDHAHLFAFEADFVASLRCIPMAVRMKLDRSAIKLTLRQWRCFTPDDRRTLLEAPCRTPHEVGLYRAKLLWLVAQRTGEEARPLAEPAVALWEAAGDIPPAVIAFARSAGVLPPPPRAWSGLSDLERFTLLKLTRDNHDNVNFVPAMQEFGLLSREGPCRSRAAATYRG